MKQLNRTAANHTWHTQPGAGLTFEEIQRPQALFSLHMDKESAEYQTHVIWGKIKGEKVGKTHFTST